MPELRRDPVVGFWTIIAHERGWRPTDFRPKKFFGERRCPFCEGREVETPPEVFTIRGADSVPNGPGWKVRAIPSKAPILSDEPLSAESNGEGIYDWREGVGRHEVIVETPRHGQDLDELPVEHVADVLRVYLDRLREMEKDPRFVFGFLFKNHGLTSGSAQDVIQHSRAQVMGLPILPKRAKQVLAAAKNYFERRERCVFCDVLKLERAEGLRKVAENEVFFAFCPYASRSPFEITLLPKKHSADFSKMEEKEVPFLASLLKECLGRLRVLLDDPPYNIVLHTAPYRRSSKDGYWKTLEEDTHWHLQIMPRLTQSAGFEWGTGVYINPTPPEEAAMLLRETEIPG